MLVHGRVVFEYLFDDFRIHSTVEESFVSLIYLQSAGPFGLLLLITATSRLGDFILLIVKFF